MTNNPNKTTSSDEDINRLHDKLKETHKKLVSKHKKLVLAHKKLVSENGELKKTYSLSENQTFDLYVGLTEMKDEISTLMKERNSKQEVKDFVEDHVFRLICNIGCVQPPNSPITPLSNDSILDSIPTWINFKSKAQVIVESFLSWRSKQPHAVRIGAHLTPWLMTEMGLSDREAYLVTSVLKDKFGKHFSH